MMMNNFEKHINDYLNKQVDCLITQASLYALEGGKRFRPRVIFAILKGMNINEEVGYDVAMALEFIQTYSLIHDDLPAMDNDDFRRGKPSVHKAFKEDIAILTGDYLLTDSFKIISQSDSYTDTQKVQIINALSKYAGIDGMIYGQLLDVTASKDDFNKDKLITIQDNKTSGLFKIACLIPMYINNMNDEQYFIDLGSLIGQIFQNQDDLFDLIKTKQQMGKDLSDSINDKATALSIYSKEELVNIIDLQFEQLDNLLLKANFDTSYLKDLIISIKER